MVLSLEIIFDDYDKCGRKCDNVVTPEELNKVYMKDYCLLKKTLKNRKNRKNYKYYTLLHKRNKCMKHKCARQTKRVNDKFPAMKRIFTNRTRKN